MTETIDLKNLSREKLQHLIETAEQHPTKQEPQLDVEEYDWEVPHHFSPNQIVTLDIFGKKLSAQITKSFTTMCQGEFNVAITSIEQHFARKLAEKIAAEQEQYYFLPFNEQQDAQCGFISISPQTALILVGQMLRDTEIDAEERELTDLEGSILMDIVTSILDALAVTLQTNGGADIRRASQLIKGSWPLPYRGLEDLTSIAFTIEHPEGTVEAAFTMLSTSLDSVAGTKINTEQTLSPQSISNLIMETMHDAPIEVNAQLCSTLISISDLIDLQPGDVLLLEKKIDEPIEVLFNEQPSLMAYPATSFGKYAVVVAPKDQE